MAATSSATSIEPRTVGASGGYAAPALAAATLLGALATLFFVFSLPLEPGGHDLVGRLAAAAFAIGMSGLACVGAILVGRSTQPGMAWLLILAGLTGVLARVNVGYALAASEWTWPGALPAAWLTNWSWVPAQAIAMSLLLRFPDGSLPRAGWRYVEWLVWAWASTTLVATAFYPGPLGAEALAPATNPVGLTGLQNLLGAVLSSAFTVMPVLLIGCAAALVVRWRRAVDDERQQLKWMAAATALLGVAAPLAIVTRTGAVIEGIAYLALPAAIAIAVLRYRLWDLGLVVRRSTVFVVASGVLAGLYLALVAVVDVLVGERGWSAAVIGALVVASVAVPIRNTAQRGLDRILFGNRRDPYAVVRDMGARLEGTGPDLLDGVVRELAGSLRVPYVAIERADGTPIAAAGTPTVEGLRRPLARAGQVLGYLVVGRRGPVEPLSQLDIQLFEDVAGHASVAVQTVLLDEELRRSYRRLRTVREGERARLQRELHDGLGPVLGAVSMRAEAARNLVRSSADAEDIDAVLAGIGVETETAVNEVRRLLDELRPTVLVDRGLIPAVTEFVDQYIRGIDVHLDLPVDMPELSAGSEVAVYRMVTEAVRNAARHSHGRTCTVRMSFHGVGDSDDGLVLVEVGDDGHGLGVAGPGIGLNAMRERILEIGGQLTLGVSAGGGLSVSARIPREAS